MRQYVGFRGISQAYYQYNEQSVLGKAASFEFALQYVRAVSSRDPGIGWGKLWHMYRSELAGLRDPSLPMHSGNSTTSIASLLQRQTSQPSSSRLTSHPYRQVLEGHDHSRQQEDYVDSSF